MSVLVADDLQTIVIHLPAWERRNPARRRGERRGGVGSGAPDRSRSSAPRSARKVFRDLFAERLFKATSLAAANAGRAARSVTRTLRKGATGRHPFGGCGATFAHISSFTNDRHSAADNRSPGVR